jgi:type 2 lantibiotic biosynthesis protein LanM
MDSDAATHGAFVDRPAEARPVEREELLTLANTIGKRLDDLALQNETSAYWLGVAPLDESTWALVPSSTDLYSGTTGIALFLAYLGAVRGDPAPTLLARRALTSIRAEVRASLAAAENEEGVTSFPTIGAFVGFPSVIYLLTHLGVVWDESDLLEEAVDLARRLPRLIPRDTYLDVLQGSAGCILVLLGLNDVRPAPGVLEAAIHCGDRLLATAQPMPHGTAWTALKGEPPLGGFSHGTAGIALSLLLLSDRSGEARFRLCALRALDYDRSLFVQEQNNWADLRVFSGKRKTGKGDESAPAHAPVSRVAWCHGAPGIGLGRLAALAVFDDAYVRREIDIGLSATKQFGFAMNHSLCHGALGNIELLLTAAQLLGRSEDRNDLERATAEVVETIEANGFVTGVPLGVETPGFMTGLAGIGYELLRLAEADTVPAALLLAPPRGQARS